MELSVIVVSYNEKQYIHQAIGSVLNQSFKDYEIIIGDDGSNDGSQEIIKDLHEKYPDKIKYFIQNREGNPKNFIPSIRVSNIIKKAISISSGKYIICLSADDYFIGNQVFIKHIETLNKDIKQQYSATVNNFIKVWDNGEKQINKLKQLPAFLYWSGNYIHLSCFMFRKSVYNNNFFLNNLCDDTGLHYSLACAGSYKYIDKIMFAYRQRSKSIMHEADKIELALLEILLFNDILTSKNYIKLFFSSLSRYSKPINLICRNKNNLGNEKYRKYISYLQTSNSNIIKAIINSNIKRGKLIAFISRFINLFFRILRFTYNQTLKKVSAHLTA